MKKFTITIAIVFLGHMALMASHPFKQVEGTDGTEDNPYQIETAEHLDAIRDEYLDKYFVQIATITFVATDFGSSGAFYNDGKGWEPIGGNRDNNNMDNSFTGHYDGAGHTIENLVINRPGEGNVGLFGHIGLAGSGATTIINVELIDATVTGGRGTGTLVGRVTGNQNTRIERCSATGTVSGDAAVGGLVGSNNSYQTNPGAAEGFRPVIYACWANVDVSLRAEATGDMIKFGGLTGCNQKGMISNSFARGSVTVNDENAARVGGFAGCVELRGIILNSYSTGIVTSTGSLVGGFLGMVGTGRNRGTESGCYWNTTDNITESAAGDGLTETEMKNSSNFSGWDFMFYWDIDGTNAINNGFPYLRETPPVPSVWVWKGGHDPHNSKWDQDGNWENEEGSLLSGYPQSDDAVRIPSGISVWPEISGDATIRNITFQENAKLQILNDASLIVTGALSFSGDVAQLPEISGEGKVILGGNDHQQIPAMTFSNLTIGNYNNVRLAGDIFVTGALVMENGLLDLSGYDIDLGSSGSLIEQEAENYSSRVYGTAGVVRTVREVGSAAGHIAGMGIELTGSDLGSTTIERGHSELPGNIEGSKSIMRWFDIKPTNTSDLDVTLVFHYSAGELNFDDANGFSLFKQATTVDDWEWVFSEVDGAAKTITASNVTSFSRWTAADANTPMPIVLLSFEGKPVDEQVELSWITVAEINNDFFTIERSANGIDFEPIATLPGAGTTSQMQHYALTDMQPLEGISYYRLKQTDFNGEYEYSGVISVLMNKGVVKANILVYPNPSNGQFNIFTGSEDAMEYRVMDMSGRIVHSSVAQPGMVNRVTLPKLPSGMYTLIFISHQITTRTIQVF